MDSLMATALLAVLLNLCWFLCALLFKQFEFRKPPSELSLPNQTLTIRVVLDG
jgi:hypothetical protein